MSRNKHSILCIGEFHIVTNGQSNQPVRLILDRSSDDDSAEKGHVERVNLQNNISAKYVVPSPLIDPMLPMDIQSPMFHLA